MSDEKDPVRVGRFEWERLMLMSVPHPTNFKLLPLGVFMSADGGRVRPGNASLAMFGPHEKTWAKLLRWAVAEGWLLQVARGGARRGPNGTTIVRASVYAASVPQPVWERRMEILGAPPFRAPGVEGSAPDPLKGAPGDSPEGLKGAPEGSPAEPDSLKGAPGTPFNAPDPSLKGAPEGSLPDHLKGANGVFEGSDPSFEGSVSGFEGSAQTLPHHVVTSRSDSSSTSSTTVVAEDSSIVTAVVSDTEEGGGGGDSFSSEDQQQDEPVARAESFVDSLDYRGKILDQKRRAKLTILVVAAFKAGWTENGLRRYLDISDDPTIRTAAGVYEHRLAEDALPPPVADPSLPPACWSCLGRDPAAVTDPSLRINPITCDPCPECHPASRVLPPACSDCLSWEPRAATDVSLRVDRMSFHGGLCPRCHPALVGQKEELPPACEACLAENPAAEFNVRFRQRQSDGGMEACPDCHPKRMVILAAHASAQSRQQQETDDWTARAMARAQKRIQTGDWRGAGPDERAIGWLQVGQQLGDGPKPMVARKGHQPYRNPEDQSVYHQPWGDPEPVDQSQYDEPL